MFTLDQFLVWCLQRPMAFMTVDPQGPVMTNESVTTLVLFRFGQFQAELVTIHPNASWDGEHRHPNVDAYEVEIFNCGGFTKNGNIVTVPDVVVPVVVAPGVEHQVRCVRLKPTDWHGIRTPVEGACLLSVQEWIGMPPTSVGLNWDGVPVSPSHVKQLGR